MRRNMRLLPSVLKGEKNRLLFLCKVIKINQMAKLQIYLNKYKNLNECKKEDGGTTWCRRQYKRAQEWK